MTHAIEGRLRSVAERVTRGRHGTRVVYGVIAGLLVASAWAALRHGGVRAVELFAANLATEAFGLLVTLAVVHRFLEGQERALRLRGSLGAVRRTGRALADMVDAWTTLVKGGLVRAPEPRPIGLAEMLAADLTAALSHLDPSDGTVVAAARRLAEARDVLRGIIATYGTTLDPVYLGAIDDLIDDPVLAYFADVLPSGATTLRRHQSVLGSARSARATHFHRLLVAVDYHNQLAREASRQRDRRTAPLGDGYAPALPLDIDLRVATQVAPEWWSVTPRPGTLRAVRNRDGAIPEADVPAWSEGDATMRNSLPFSELTKLAQPVRSFRS